jgi:hypothetical protein
MFRCVSLSRFIVVYVIHCLNPFFHVLLVCAVLISDFLVWFLSLLFSSLNVSN